MRDKIIVVAGLAFGDEGKGSYTDFLTKEYDIKTLVRYAGGNQSNRTVTLPNGKQLEFSQLSSGMVNPDTHTYITKNVIVSLDNLIEEINDLAKLTDENPIKILDRVHINKDCVCVTPYHKLINHLNEIIAGSERRGSVGLGASEARYLNDTFNISIKFSDLIYSKNKYRNFRDLYDFAERLFEEVNDKVMNKLPENIAYLIQEEAMNLLNEKALNLIIRRETNIALALSKTIFDSDEEIVLTKEKVMFEGSLGLLIDKDYGLKPNTSLCDTSNSYPKKIISRDDAIYYGIIRSYYQRHGRGVFPTESRFLRKQLSSDKGDAGYWNGRVRYGWFDSVLYRYSIKVAEVDEVLVSSLDALSNIKEIKICDYYFYNGLIDDEFKKTFSYKISNEGVRIYDIKNISSPRISYYLRNVRPHYMIMKGWNTDIRDIKSYEELPDKCKSYIKTIERLSHKKISYVSLGPTNESKIKIPKRNVDEK